MAEWAAKYGVITTGGSDCHDRVDWPLGVAGVSQAELTRYLADSFGDKRSSSLMLATTKPIFLARAGWLHCAQDRSSYC
jgi:hypothetical protein